jgi:hypothetical protein
MRILSDAAAVSERLLLRFNVSKDRSSSAKGMSPILGPASESESELSPLGRMLRRALTRFASLRVAALRNASVGVVLRRVALHCWTLRFAPLRGYDHFVFFLHDEKRFRFKYEISDDWLDLLIQCVA